MSRPASFVVSRCTFGASIGAEIVFVMFVLSVLLLLLLALSVLFVLFVLFVPPVLLALLALPARFNKRTMTADVYVN